MAEGEGESASPMAKSLDVRIWRGREDGAFQTYQVPEQANQTVLDVVTYVQRALEPGLAYRFACRVGMCGSCAMMVNGRPRWTCRSHVRTVLNGRKLELAPLRNLPVIRDLVADLDPFFDKWQRAEARFVPSASRADPIARVPPASPGRVAADRGIECINCAVCHAACDVVAWKADYLGPAALNRAWTLMNDARDAGGGSRLQALAAAGGCHACHSQASCTAHCPNLLDPSGSVAGLKALVVKAALRGGP
jgi:fumarate reductase iron-sulfur subunit